MTISDSETVPLITRNGMGDAPPELQQKLMTTYLALLAENQILPAAICFYTEGVRLAVDGSPILDVFKSLQSRVYA